MQHGYDVALTGSVRIQAGTTELTGGTLAVVGAPGANDETGYFSYMLLGAAVDASNRRPFYAGPPLDTTMPPPAGSRGGHSVDVIGEFICGPMNAECDPIKEASLAMVVGAPGYASSAGGVATGGVYGFGLAGVDLDRNGLAPPWVEEYRPFVPSELMNNPVAARVGSNVALAHEPSGDAFFYTTSPVDLMYSYYSTTIDTTP